MGKREEENKMKKQRKRNDVKKRKNTREKVQVYVAMSEEKSVWSLAV